MDVLFAAEFLLPPRGGAERLALELLERLADRHAVRACWLGRAPAPAWLEGRVVDPPGAADGYWRDKRLRREAIAGAVGAELERRRANVVVTQLHAAPGVVDAAAAAATPSVLVLPSYESFCKHAFDVKNRCMPESGCTACPAALALPPEERDELARARVAHERSLHDADLLVAISRMLVDVCARWCGRVPELIPGSVRAAPRLRADPGGPVVVAARWGANGGIDKGVALLEPIARGLPRRRLRVTEGGLDPGVRARLEALDNVEVVPEAPFVELLDGASLLLVPSQWPEPFGRAAFEGLAGGVPTLASATGGLLDFVPPEQSVGRFDDACAWLEAIEQLEDGDRWEAARARGLSAARAVLAPDPAARFEAALRAVAA